MLRKIVNITNMYNGILSVGIVSFQDPFNCACGIHNEAPTTTVFGEFSAINDPCRKNLVSFSQQDMSVLVVNTAFLVFRMILSMLSNVVGMRVLLVKV